MCLTLRERSYHERFDERYAKHSRSEYGFLLNIVGNAEDAGDATVETFRRVWVGLPKFCGESSPRTWILRIAFTVALSTKSTVAKRPVSLDGLSQSQIDPVANGKRSFAEATHDKLHCEQILAGLPPKQRAALWLRIGLQYADEEVAEILGIPVGTVKSWVWRATARLRLGRRAERRMRDERV